MLASVGRGAFRVELSALFKQERKPLGKRSETLLAQESDDRRHPTMHMGLLDEPELREDQTVLDGRIGREVAAASLCLPHYFGALK